MFDPMAVASKAVAEALEEPAFARDEEFLAALLRLMAVMNRYFDAEVRGLERVPDGAALLVGNHSGGFLTPDTTALISAWYRQRGLGSPLVGLAFDAAFAIPGFATIMRKLGQVPANMENAGRALDEGAAVLVYPGGEYEVYRPWDQRNQIQFNGHLGFIRLALRHRVPVIPVVGHGGHHTTIVLTRGERIARSLQLERLRMHIFPLVWQLPWGVSSTLPMGLPLPAKVTVEVCEALDWSRYGPDDADDPEVLQRCYDEITGAMQEKLTALAEERPFPVASRVRGLFPSGRSQRSQPRHLAKGAAMSGKKSRTRLPDLVRDAVDQTASSAEEIHKSIANFPLDVLDRLEILESTTSEVRRVQEKSIEAIYDLVRGINREVTRLANEILEGDVGKRRARKPARRRPRRKTAEPQAAGQAA